jgi:hypothetical protein
MAMKMTLRALLVSAALVVSFGFSANASAAATFECTPVLAHDMQDVIWDGGGLFIDCAGAPASAPRWTAILGNTCSGGAPSIDTIKIWESLATEALLSGRKLVITYTTNGAAGCTGIGWITALGLWRVP